MVEAQQNSHAGEKETKECKMCRRQICVTKFRMHEIGCVRSNFFCERCGMAVPKTDKEQHEIDAHTEQKKLKCNQCRIYETTDAQMLTKHSVEECPERFEKCKMCV